MLKFKKAFKLIFIHDIKSNIYNNINYAVLILLIFKKINKKLMLMQIQRKFHLINNFKINILMLKRITVNLH